MIAKERSVSEYVPAAPDVHGVTEVSEGRTDHVRGEVAFEATFPLRMGDQALQARQLTSQVHAGADRDKWQIPLVSTKLRRCI